MLTLLLSVVCVHGMLHALPCYVFGARYALNSDLHVRCTILMLHFTSSRTSSCAADATSSKLPLRRWPGKNKNSLRDPLLLEERIALVLITYAPNLWKVSSITAR